ncbi:MAG: DUF934 domain-containing protein [Geminicoccaceae bacterium]
MPLLRGDQVVADDWQALAAGEPLPAGGRILVPYARLLAEPEAFAGFAGELGVRIEPGERVEALAPWLGRLRLVAVVFPSFGDGRGFSTARLLRERHGFAGELRAVGNLLVDLRQFLRQCGFDSFELPEGRLLDNWRRPVTTVSLSYQTDYAVARGPEAVWQARRQRRALAAE